MFVYKNTHWTSELIIKSTAEVNPVLVESILNYIENDFSKFSDSKLTSTDKLNLNLEEVLEYADEEINALIKLAASKFELTSDNKIFISIDEGKSVGVPSMSESILDFITYKFDGTIASLDFTGLLKGLAMQVISNSIKSDKFLISFGHDIYARNWDKITIKITNKFSIEAQDSFVCFTSGNNKERGDHIRVVSSINSSITSATYYKQLINSNNYLECIIADMKATKHFSTQANDEHIYFTDNSTGKLVFTEKVYCASPFFCDYDRAVRDKMIEAIPKHLVFRPDATKSSKKFSKVLAKGQSKKNAKVALKVFKDNVDHISRSDILVFPKYTNDLGTLMEVGIALGRVKILRYNYLNDTYTKVCDYLDNISIDTSTMYSFTDKVRQKGVLLGFDYSTNSGDRDIYYHLAGNPDNIMLSESSIRYDKCDDKYVKVSTTYVEGM